MPNGELTLQDPPGLPEMQPNTSAVMTYVPMALASAGTVLLFVRPGSGGVSTYLAAGLMVISSLAMLIGQMARGTGDRKRKLRGDRRDYLRYLAQQRRRVRKIVLSQRDAQSWRNPDPQALWSLVRTSRLWERRFSHEDFSEARIAVGEQRLGMRIASLETKPIEDLEPLCAHALRRFIRAYGTVADQPTTVFLRGYALVRLRGDEEAARRLARAVIAQLAMFHAPEELRMAFCVSAETAAEWEWVKWLPHALHLTERDAGGQVRLVAADEAGLDRVLAGDLADRPRYDPAAVPSAAEPFWVIVVDGKNPPTEPRMSGSGFRNAVVIDVTDTLGAEHSSQVLTLQVTDDSLHTAGLDRNGRETLTLLGRPDGLSVARAQALGRMLAPYRTAVATVATEPLTTDFDLAGLLGIADLRGYDVFAAWGDKTAAQALRVPFGMTADGGPVSLDIKESALRGMGPHGMLIGATGSGKSELLRTLVLGMAITHSPEILNFVLVDFKGGATFLGMEALPHTSAVITNLAGEAALVSRMKDALRGELIRRQEHLRAAGNYVNIHEYERARRAGARIEPMPALFVIVDEFSELLAAHRDFMDLFMMIGRLGRSLGVHLLLASQRLDEGRVQQLETHMSYRIALRTFSAIESRAVLGVTDAYQLPTMPGNGLLRNEAGTLVRFKAAYVSGAYQPRPAAAAAAFTASGVMPCTTDFLELAPGQQPVEEAGAVQDSAVQEADAADAAGGSLLDLAIGRLSEAGAAPGAPPAARRIWLPPLDESPTLDELLGSWEAGGRRLTVPVGVIDRPFEQRRDPLLAELVGAGGHIAIAGGPQSGKSTLLRTIICSLAITHSPRDVQFYCLDFGGGTLSGLDGLPHVGGITGRLDPERVKRTVAEMASLVARRERLFAERGIDSMATLRRMRAAGQLPTEAFGDAFLVVDGWGTMRQDYFDLAQAVTSFAGRSLNYGVHLLVASPRWADIPPSLRDHMTNRFELRLGDPIDSVIGMRAAATVPRKPGRGLTQDQMHFLTALPRIDGSADPDGLADGLSDLVERVRGGWAGEPAAPPVRMLPAVITTSQLPAPPPGDSTFAVPLGIEENELGPIVHDFDTAPHLLVIGDTESGKTNLLRLVADAVTRRYSPDEARVMVVDTRRELYGCVPEPHQLGYAVSAEVVRELVVGAKEALVDRVPGPEITPDRFKARDWWNGPELFLVVDDYDLVAPSYGEGPLAPLTDLLAHGAEIGLHLVIARAAAGVGRGMNDPLLRRLTDLNTPAYVLSCPPSEGPLFGNVPMRQLPVGRARVITRRGTLEIQTALFEG